MRAVVRHELTAINVDILARDIVAHDWLSEEQECTDAFLWLADPPEHHRFAHDLHQFR